MVFMLILTTSTVLAAVGSRIRTGTHRWRPAARTGLGVALAIAGVGHLVDPVPFEQHLPGWVPAATAIVVVSGLIEIGLGIALLFARSAAPSVGLVTSAFLVGVFPANVYVAVAGVEVDGLPGGIYPWLRLPLQAVFVAWAWWSTRPAGTGDDAVGPVERHGRPRLYGLMPPVPSTAGPGDDRSTAPSTVQASELRLRRFRDVPALMIAALRLRDVFAATPGAIWMSLRAAPLRRTFWTLSQWEADADLHGFVAHPAHLEVMRRFRPAMRSSSFTTWHTERDRPPTWDDAGPRIAASRGDHDTGGPSPVRSARDGRGASRSS